MPKIPPLPAALVAVLGVIASVLAVVQPSLPDPWPAIVGGLLALLTLVGVPVTLRTIRAHGRAAYAHRVHQEAAGRGAWRRDDGMSRVAVLAATAVTLLLVASAVVVAMSPAEASPGRGPGRPTSTQAALVCPSPYVAREVRVYGQRIESDVNASGSFQVIAQNDWATTKAEDPRYVVALVCTRSINNAENNELFAWGSK